MDYFAHGVGHADREDGIYDLADERLPEARYVAPDSRDYGYRPSPNPVGMHVTGTELRRRFVTPEMIEAIHTEEPKKSLLQTLIGRLRKRG